MGIFPYLDDLLRALESVKELKKDYTVFSPTARHEIKEAVGMKPSPVRYFTLFGGLLGAISGVSLAVYTVLQWKFIVSGKPVIPWAPFVIVAFEFTILFGVLITVIGMLLTTRLPRFRLPSYYDPRFSKDRFGIMVPCDDNEREKVKKLLEDAGAEEIHEVQS